MSFHENLAREEDLTIGTERSFGLVMAGFFSLVGLLPVLHGGQPRWIALAIAAVFGVLGLVAPRLLAPANRAWMALGRLLNHIVSPLVMGLLFTIVVVPTSLLLRLSGKDPLRLKLDKSATSYWQMRTPPGPAPGSLKQQF